MNKTIDIPQQKGKSIFPHILILGGGGLLLLETLPFIITGIIVLLLGIFALFAKTGLMIDVKSNKTRRYLKLFNFYFGKWESLPEVNYIALVRVRMSRLKFRPSEVSFRQTGDSFDIAYDVNFIFSNSTTRYKKIYNGNVEDAKKLAFQLAKEFDVKIYDSSTSIKKWIEKDQIQ